MKYTVTLSTDEVKTIIAQHFNDAGAGISPNDVELNVITDTVGYGMNERLVAFFKDCTVNLKLKNEG